MSVQITKINPVNFSMNLLFVILINFSLSHFSCTGKISDGKNDPLPDKRPEKFIIEYRLDGGMRYYSEALYISEDSSYFTINDGGAISRINFILDDKELDRIYKVFTDNEFDRIQTYEEKVYDRGGNSVYLRWGNGKFNSVSSSGMNFIDKDWIDEWNICISSLRKIISTQSDKQKKEYEIRFGKSLFGKKVNVHINNYQLISGSILASEQDNEESITKSALLIPGKHRLSISWDKHGDNIIIDADSTKSVMLLLVNDSLVYNFFN